MKVFVDRYMPDSSPSNVTLKSSHCLCQTLINDLISASSCWVTSLTKLISDNLGAIFGRRNRKLASVTFGHLRRPISTALVSPCSCSKGGCAQAFHTSLCRCVGMCHSITYLVPLLPLVPLVPLVRYLVPLLPMAPLVPLVRHLVALVPLLPLVR